MSASVFRLRSLPKFCVRLGNFQFKTLYQKFGFKPSSYRSSLEALIRRILQGKDLSCINSVVDAYNLISITGFLPGGGDDMDQVVGDIRLTIAEGTERFIMLGKDQPEEIKKGEVIYRDDEEVLCRAWNYRECDKSKITKETKNVCLVLEGLDSTSEEELRRELTRLRNLLMTFCGGSGEEFYLCDGNEEVCF